MRAKDPSETWEQWLDGEVRELSHLCGDAPSEMVLALAETVMGRLQRDESTMRDLETFLRDQPLHLVDARRFAGEQIRKSLADRFLLRRRRREPAGRAQPPAVVAAVGAKRPSRPCVSSTLA